MTLATKRGTVGARELKTRLGRYLRAVRMGATLVVTDRGEAVAELRPLPRGATSVESRLAELAALGVLTRASGKPLAAFEPIHLRGPALSETISDERADRA